jgi:hypothetical protein
MRLCTPYCFDDSMQRFPYIDVTERYPGDVRCVKRGVLMNIDVEIHSWNLAGADFVSVNQIFSRQSERQSRSSRSFLPCLETSKRNEQKKYNRETISRL